MDENADLVLWVASFVLLSLLINAPLVSPVMTWTGLAKARVLGLRGLGFVVWG